MQIVLEALTKYSLEPFVTHSAFQPWQRKSNATHYFYRYDGPYILFSFALMRLWDNQFLIKTKLKQQKFTSKRKFPVKN